MILSCLQNGDDIKRCCFFGIDSIGGGSGEEKEAKKDKKEKKESQEGNSSSLPGENDRENLSHQEETEELQEGEREDTEVEEGLPDRFDTRQRKLEAADEGMVKNAFDSQKNASEAGQGTLKNIALQAVQTPSALEEMGTEYPELGKSVRDISEETSNLVDYFLKN